MQRKPWKEAGIAALLFLAAGVQVFFMASLGSPEGAEQLQHIWKGFGMTPPAFTLAILNASAKGWLWPLPLLCLLAGGLALWKNASGTAFAVALLALAAGIGLFAAVYNPATLLRLG